MSRCANQNHTSRGVEYYSPYCGDKTSLTSLASSSPIQFSLASVLPNISTFIIPLSPCLRQQKPRSCNDSQQRQNNRRLFTPFLCATAPGETPPPRADCSLPASLDIFWELGTWYELLRSGRIGNLNNTFTTVVTSPLQSCFLESHPINRRNLRFSLDSTASEDNIFVQWDRKF